MQRLGPRHKSVDLHSEHQGYKSVEIHHNLPGIHIHWGMTKPTYIYIQEERRSLWTHILAPAYKSHSVRCDGILDYSDTLSGQTNLTTHACRYLDHPAIRTRSRTNCFLLALWRSLRRPAANAACNRHDRFGQTRNRLVTDR